MRLTFKVHKIDPRDVVDGVARAEIVTLHPIDPHEKGAHDHAIESRSGEGKLILKVTDPRQLGRFAVGRYVSLDITFLT